MSFNQEGSISLNGIYHSRYISCNEINGDIFIGKALTAFN